MVLRTTLQVLPLPKYNFSLWMPIIAKVLAHMADRSIELRVIQVLSLSVSFSTKNTFMTIKGTVFLGFGYDFGI